MANIDNTVIYDDYPHGAQRERRYKTTITPNSLVNEEYVLSPVVVDVSDDGSDAANVKFQQLADTELAAEKVAQYQDQDDYDRRALGHAMMISDINDFHDTLPLFLAMEVRGGANANARALYL